MAIKDCLLEDQDTRILVYGLGAALVMMMAIFIVNVCPPIQRLCGCGCCKKRYFPWCFRFGQLPSRRLSPEDGQQQSTPGQERKQQPHKSEVYIISIEDGQQQGTFGQERKQQPHRSEDSITRLEDGQQEGTFGQERKQQPHRSEDYISSSSELEEARGQICTLKEEKKQLEEELKKLKISSRELEEAREQIRTLEEEKKQLAEELEKLKISSLELEEARGQIRTLKEEKKHLEEELDKLNTRLSGIISDRMRENNPDIVDLSDQYRPDKLGDISSEIYDNEWTDAFDVLEGEDGRSATEAIRILLDTVMVTYTMYRIRADQQWQSIVKRTGESASDEETTLRLKQTLLDERRKKAESLFADLKEAIVSKLGSHYGIRLQHLLNTKGPVQSFLDACLKLCSHMVVQVPPVVWYCPGWRDIELRSTNPNTMTTGDVGAMKGTVGNLVESDTASEVTEYVQNIPFDKKLFREYMRAGELFDYVLWPAMLQYKNGPTLRKGVAQGCPYVN